MSFLKKVKSVFRKEDDMHCLQCSGNNNNCISSSIISDNNVIHHRPMQRFFTGNTNGGPNIWPVHPDVQREIQNGTHLNMKAVLRGMRGTGKSTIVSRLCGYTPLNDYTPSPEISAGTIFYRSCTDRANGGAKVEVWDVVDEGFRTDQHGNKIENVISSADASALTSNNFSSTLADARTIDVYRNCHLAAFVIDRTKKETLDYAVRQARHVPPTTCILFILNFNDAPKEKHTVMDCDVDTICKSLRRTTSPMILEASAGRLPPENYSAAATWVSISAFTGYGMDMLRSAFEIPYVFVNLLTLESRIHSYFQFIEQHQAWLLCERANLHFLEKEKMKESKERDNQQQLDIINSTLHKEGDGNKKKSEEEKIISSFHTRENDQTNDNHKVEEEDENGIAKGFFDGFDDEKNNTEEEQIMTKTKRKESNNRSISISSSSSNNNNNNNNNENNNSNNNLTALPVMHSIPGDEQLLSSSSTPFMPGTNSTVIPISNNNNNNNNYNNIPFILDDMNEVLKEKEELKDEFTNRNEIILNIAKDVEGLDDDFFGAVALEEQSGKDTAISIEREIEDSNHDITLISETKESREKIKPITSMSVTNTFSQIMNTSSIETDVSLLLKQMQEALETAAVGEKKEEEEESSRPRHSKIRSHNRRKEKKNSRRSGRHSEVEKQEKFKMPIEFVDDGGFDVIQE